jgi:molybdopterin molybdotransferase
MPRSRNVRWPTGSATVPEALEILQRSIPPSRATDRVAVRDALGRVAAEDARARQTVPAESRSRGAGYAVRVPLAKRHHPLRVIGGSRAGDDPRRLPRVSTTTCLEVESGSPLPPGANAVAWREDCRRRGGRITIAELPRPQENFIARGEDYFRGEIVIAQGSRIRPWHIAAALAAEIPRVRVHRPPRVGLISTGSSSKTARPVGSPWATRNTTPSLVTGQLREIGAEVVDLGPVPNELPRLNSALRRALRTCDVVAVISGSEIGQTDRFPAAVGAFPRSRRLFRYVSLRPGSATSAWRVGGKLVVGLSGLPVSGFAGSRLVLEPYLARSYPAIDLRADWVVARLAKTIEHPKGFREMARVRLRRRRGEWEASLYERRGAGRLSSLTGVDGIVELEESRGDYRAGETVMVRRL